jgi:anti-sigma B factor antagonist
MRVAEFEVQSGPGRVVVAGEIDLRTSPELREALADASAVEGSEVVIDLTGVTFIDSSGISELLRASNAGHRLRLRHPAASVRSLFELAGLDQVADVEP